MINQITASPNSANATTPSFEVKPRSATTPTPSTQKSVSSNEDTVELSTTAQSMVEDLVRAAAAGDQGALSLLTVI